MVGLVDSRQCDAAALRSRARLAAPCGPFGAYELLQRTRYRLGLAGDAAERAQGALVDLGPECRVTLLAIQKWELWTASAVSSRSDRRAFRCWRRGTLGVCVCGLRRRLRVLSSSTSSAAAAAVGRPWWRLRRWAASSGCRMRRGASSLSTRSCTPPGGSWLSSGSTWSTSRSRTGSGRGFQIFGHSP